MGKFVALHIHIPWHFIYIYSIEGRLIRRVK